MSLLSRIESILFVASKPLSTKSIAKAVGKNEVEVEEAIDTLKRTYNQEDSGIHILESGDTVQMGTNPDHAALVAGFVKDEVSGELTRAQLETLTVIAYRSPVTRPEIEHIRGVNCALILRNLLVRGLIEEQEDKEKLSVAYTLSMDALRHLGIRSVHELMQYEELHAHEYIEDALRDFKQEHV